MVHCTLAKFAAQYIVLGSDTLYRSPFSGVSSLRLGPRRRGLFFGL